MRIADRASIRNIRPEIAVAIAIASDLARRSGLSGACISSGTEGQHSRNSLHYVGAAVDFDAIDFHSRTVREKFRDELSSLLGNEYDVIAEQTHVHCEFQPKGQK